MKYLFCNLIIEIEDFPINLMERYAEFHTEAKNKSDILIRVEQNEIVEVPNGEPIYQFDTWLKIYNDNGVESRYYYDCISGKLKAYYNNSEDNKVLTIVKETADSLLSELEIINTIGLESVLSKTFPVCRTIEVRQTD